MSHEGPPSPDQPQPEKQEKKTDPPERPAPPPPPPQKKVSRRDMLKGLRERLSGLPDTDQISEQEEQEKAKEQPTQPADTTPGTISRRSLLKKGAIAAAITGIFGIGAWFGGKKEKKPQIDTSTPEKLMESFPDKIPGGSVEKIDVPGAKRVIFAIRQVHKHPSAAEKRMLDKDSYARDKSLTQSVQNDIEATLQFLHDEYQLNEVFVEGYTTGVSQKTLKQLQERHRKKINEMMKEKQMLGNDIKKFTRWKNDPKLYEKESKKALFWVGEPYNAAKLDEQIQLKQSERKDIVRAIDDKKSVLETHAAERLAVKGTLEIMPGDSKETLESGRKNLGDKKKLFLDREDKLFEIIDQSFRKGETSNQTSTSFVYGGDHDMPAALKRFNKKSKTPYSLIYITPTTYPEEEKK